MSVPDSATDGLTQKQVDYQISKNERALSDLKALKLDGLVEASTNSLSLSGPDSGSDSSAPSPPLVGLESSDMKVTPSYIKENAKNDIMRKSIDDLLND